MRICGGLATGRASQGRIYRLRARQFWREQESCRNPKESRGIRSNSVTGIPVPQKFLQKNHLKVAENRNFENPSKTTFLRTKSSGKNGKKSSGNLCFFCFSVQKKFLSNRNYQPCLQGLTHINTHQKADLLQVLQEK
jgi:hypothetical protein